MSYIPMTFGMILSRFFELARAKWRLLWSVSAIYLSVIIVLAANESESRIIASAT